MAYKSLLKSAALARYVNETLVHESELKKRLRAETAQLPQGGIQVSPDIGAFLSFLVGLIQARKVLEIGTFTGYSAICIAEALSAGGKVLTCDWSEEWTSVARRYWREAKLDERIELRLGDAMPVLQSLIQAGEEASFDFIFIDPYRETYEEFYELSLRLLRPGGLIVMDNLLTINNRLITGIESREGYEDPADGPMHWLNLRIRDDRRVEARMATVGSGIWLVRKRDPLESAYAKL